MLTPSVQLQYHLPPYKQVNKDFFKLLLKDEKRAFKVTQVRQIIVPKLDELGIKYMLQMVKDDEELMMYLPDDYLKKMVPDRAFFFNTINTIYPNYLYNLVVAANK
jgi:hypothetical protein